MTIDGQDTESPSFSLNDIYFVLFRHKWKILFFAVVGLGAAIVAYRVVEPAYKSQAKLLIRYIHEARNPMGSMDPNSQVKTVDVRGETIMSSEMEILGSFDLAKVVAEKIGPEKLIGPGNTGPAAVISAAALINKSLSINNPQRSNIILVQFAHANPDVVQQVLAAIIDEYKEKHVEIHKGVGKLGDYFIQRTDELRTRLAATEERLKEIKSQSGVISLPDSKKAYIEEISRIRQDLFAAEAEIAQRKAALKALEPTHAETQDVETPEGPTLPQETVNTYLGILSQLETLQVRHRELQANLTEENPVVKRVQIQIHDLRSQKRGLETNYPGLTSILVTSGTTNGSSFDVSAEISRIKALEAKVQVLTNQWSKIHSEASALDAVESAITELTRRREVDDTTFRHYSSSLEQARLDQALGPGKVSNINTVQEPSPPIRDSSKLKKTMMMLAGGGASLGIVLAFLIDLFLDSTVKRPQDLAVKLKLPVFLTIPFLPRKAFRSTVHRNGSDPAAAPQKKSESTIGYEEVTWKGNHKEMAPWDPEHPLHGYFEAMRDRLVADFEFSNMTHKPKLVAVTSCSKGSGVSTLATGLAASLSETAGGNVLLVDMNVEKGAAHPLFRGKPGCGLPDVLEHDKRELGMLHENFYVASAQETSDKLPRILPKRFLHLVPKMKASDYDYIIFDMPPVSQTSVTARLAALMDRVILVVDAEETSRELVKQAQHSLTDSKANVSTILNNRRCYVPQWLQKEL